MSFSLPRKRTLLGWHRWMGFISALFLLVLSITGLALNHTTTLKLDQIEIRNPFLLSRYGMAGADAVDVYRIHNSDTLAHLDGKLFYNGERLATAGEPVGIHEGTPITVVATSAHLIYLTPSGELIEHIDTTQLPFSKINALGHSTAGQPVIATPEGAFRPDADWVGFTAFGGSYQVDPLPRMDLSPAEAKIVLDEFQGGGVSLYRILLDLHSGRLFGWSGRTLMDLTALAVILLISTGISGWLRKARKPQKKRAA